MAPRPTFVGGNVRRRRLIHRLPDAEEVQRLRFDERQTRLEDFFGAVGKHLNDRAFIALPADEVAEARHQYSAASMIVSTRVVFTGSAGSSDPNCIAASK